MNRNVNVRRSLLLVAILLLSCGATVQSLFGQQEAFKVMLGASDKNSGLQREGYHVWGSSVIKGEDGKFHMFSSSWARGGDASWITHSSIIHSVSETPEGPFEFVAEALPPLGDGHWDGNCTHNPTIHRHLDTFLLFYLGSHYTDVGDKKKNQYEALANKRIGMAWSTSLDGPWNRFDKPILEPRDGMWDGVITSNPAPYIEDDGGVLLVYKSWTRHATDYYSDRKPGEVNQLLGAARAEHFLDTFSRIREDRIYSEYPTPFNAEDPYIWKEGGQYHMLAKIFAVGEDLIGEASGGFHATSPDGAEWTIDTSGAAAWSKTVYWSDGTSETFDRVERPQLLIQDSVPTHIYLASRYDNGTEWRSICIPLNRDRDNPTLAFENETKLTAKTYTTEDVLAVTTEFSTTTGRVVHGAGIKVTLYEMDEEDKPVRAIQTIEDKSAVGNPSGKVSVSVSLASIEPSDSLTNGHYYAIGASFVESGGYVFTLQDPIGPIMVQSIASISQTLKSQKTVLCPNPADEIILVKGDECYLNAKFYNEDGKLCLDSEISNNEISIAGLPKGFYLVALSNPTTEEVAKLLVR